MTGQSLHPRSVRPLPAGALLALLLTAAQLTAGEAQATVGSEPIDERAIEILTDGEAGVVDRVVATNAEDVERLARRWYGQLNGRRALGEGSVVVYARVRPDGTVAEAVVPVAGPHHPVLNVLARRAVRAMVFAPTEADGRELTRGEVGERGYWVAQRVNFRP